MRVLFLHVIFFGIYFQVHSQFSSLVIENEISFDSLNCKYFEKSELDELVLEVLEFNDLKVSDDSKLMFDSLSVVFNKRNKALNGDRLTNDTSTRKFSDRDYVFQVIPIKSVSEGNGAFFVILLKEKFLNWKSSFILKNDGVDEYFVFGEVFFNSIK